MEARYFDGVSATGETVDVEVVEHGLRVTRADGSVAEWPHGSYRQRGHHVERRGEYLVASGDLPDPGRRTRHLLIAAALATALVAIAAGVYFGQSLFFRGLANLVPRGAEERLGEAALMVVAPADRRVTGAPVEVPVGRIVDRLRASARTDYELRVIVSKADDVNAWAAPGGFVGVHCGLVRQMRSGDELAAVMAHEFSHVVERHATRNLLRVFTLRLALTLVGGGDLDALLDAAGVLGALHFMRGDEAAADRGALDLLVRSGIDPRAMGRAFERLEGAAGDLPGALRYLSSHPPIAERRRQAEAAASGARGTFAPVLAADEFTKLQAACR